LIITYYDSQYAVCFSYELKAMCFAR